MSVILGRETTELESQVIYIKATASDNVIGVTHWGGLSQWGEGRSVMFCYIPDQICEAEGMLVLLSQCSDVCIGDLRWTIAVGGSYRR